MLTYVFPRHSQELAMRPAPYLTASPPSPIRRFLVDPDDILAEFEAAAGPAE